MRFTASIKIWLTGAVREPSFWSKFKGLLSGEKPEAELELTRDALSIAESVCAGLRGAGVTNAVLLSVDQEVLYRDLVDLPDDVGLLLQAAREHGQQMSKEFKALRLVFEWKGDGLETLIEATFHRRFQKGRPAATVSIGGRLIALRPMPGESSEEARGRIADVLRDPSIPVEFHKEFAELSDRIRTGLHQEFPTAEVSLSPPVSRIQRPTPRQLGRLAKSSIAGPRALRSSVAYDDDESGMYYDPWNVYYDDPVDTWTDLTLIDSLLDREDDAPAFGFPLHVTDSTGAPLCEADAISQSQVQFSGLHEAASLDYSTPVASPLPESYGWGQDSSGNDTSSSDGGSSFGSSDGPSSDCTSSDCVSSDCASSDCASSDCSSDCASSDCASSDCASSGCASSDCSGGGDW